MLPMTIGNNKVLFSLDASGGNNNLKWWFPSLDVKIDSLPMFCIYSYSSCKERVVVIKENGYLYESN